LVFLKLTFTLLITGAARQKSHSEAGMLSPRTGLGLEAEKNGLNLGLGLDGSGLGLGLETLRPRPRVVWPRGLVYCNVLFHDLTQIIVNFSLIQATATVKSAIMKTVKIY